MEQKDNPMRDIRMDKLVINIGTSNDVQKQTNAKRLLEIIAERKPVDELSRKRIPAFKISKGTKIGAFVTVRKGQSKLAKRLLDAVDNKLKESSVGENSASFGINEYIDIGGVKYDPTVGMLGMNVNLSFKRKGMRVRNRKRKSSRVPNRHRIVTKEEVKNYLEKEFGVEFI
jgi:large subunit ribosomal protein L5